MDRLHTDPAPPRHWPPLPWGLSLSTFNIRDGRGSGIVQALQVVHLDGFNVMLLMDTKITDQDYLRNILGYDMVCVA